MRTILSIFWNYDERRLRALLRLVGQIILLVLVALLLKYLILAITGVIALATQTLTPDQINLESLRQIRNNFDVSNGHLLSEFFATASLLLSVWLAGRLLDRRRFADFGLHLSRSWWVDFAFGAGLGAVLMAGIFLTELAAGWITITGAFVTGNPDTPFIIAILLPVLIFALIGLQEELLSRGYQLINMAEGLRLGRIGPRGATIIAVLLSSTIFGVMHATNPNATALSTFNICLAGILLALGYVLTGELAIPIGLHFTWNLFQGNIFGFTVSGMRLFETTLFSIDQGGPALWTGGDFGPEAGLLGIGAMVIGSLLIVLWVRQWREKTAPLHQQLSQPQESAQPAAVDG